MSLLLLFKPVVVGSLNLLLKSGPAAAVAAALVVPPAPGPVHYFGTANEALTAQEVITAKGLFLASDIEAASAADIESAKALLAASDTEAATAVDIESAKGLFAGARTELATAVDTESAKGLFVASDIEVATALDLPSALAKFAASDVETASAADIETAATVVQTHGPVSYLLLFSSQLQAILDPVVQQFYTYGTNSVGCNPDIVVYDLVTGQADTRWGIFITQPPPVVLSLLNHPKLALAASRSDLGVITVLQNNLLRSVTQYQFIVQGIGVFPI